MTFGSGFRAWPTLRRADVVPAGISFPTCFKISRPADFFKGWGGRTPPQSRRRLSLGSTELVKRTQPCKLEKNLQSVTQPSVKSSVHTAASVATFHATIPVAFEDVEVWDRRFLRD